MLAEVAHLRCLADLIHNPYDSLYYKGKGKLKYDFLVDHLSNCKDMDKFFIRRKCCGANFRQRWESKYYFIFRSHQVMLRVYSSFCTQEVFLALLRDPYDHLPGIKYRLATYKTNALLIVLLSWPPDFNFSYELKWKYKRYNYIYWAGLYNKEFIWNVYLKLIRQRYCLMTWGRMSPSDGEKGAKTEL